MRRTAALIAGAGPAGSAAAITLARAGLRPLLIERTRGPQDLVCGAFLGWDALARLARMGIDPQALGARPITRLRLIAGTAQSEVDLPHPAAGLSRQRLDEALRSRAVALGAGLEEGVAIRHAAGRMLALADGTDLTGEALFLATGKHDLRGLARPRDPHAAVGLKRRLAPSTALGALEGCIELHLFPGGYAGLLLQEDGAANLCLSVATARLTAAGGVPALVAQLAAQAPRLGERLGRAGGEWRAIAGVPYGWRTADTAPGLFRIGDQAAVIASLAGDGVAIALASGEGAAGALLRDGPAGAPRWQATFAARAARPLATAGLLKALGESRYGGGVMARAAGALPAVTRWLAGRTRIG